MIKEYLKPLIKKVKKIQKVTAWLVVFFLLFGCLVPAFNVVEMKALLISANVFSDKPFMADYYDILEFSQNIVNGFYIAQCIAKGITPKPCKKSLPKKDPRNNDWASDSGSILRFDKNANLGFVQALSSVTNLFCDKDSSCVPAAVFRTGASPRDDVGAYMLFLFMLLFILPRGSLDPSIINSNTNILANKRSSLNF